MRTNVQLFEDGQWIHLGIDFRTHFIEFDSDFPDDQFFWLPRVSFRKLIIRKGYNWNWEIRVSWFWAALRFLRIVNKKHPDYDHGDSRKTQSAR